MFYVMMHSTHFMAPVYMAIVEDHSAREETSCCHFIGYFFELAERNLLYMLWPL